MVAKGCSQQGGDGQRGSIGRCQCGGMKLGRRPIRQTTDRQSHRVGLAQRCGHAHGVGHELALRHRLGRWGDTQGEVEDDSLHNHQSLDGRIVCQEVRIVTQRGEGMGVASAWLDIATAPAILLWENDRRRLKKGSRTGAAIPIAHHQGQVDTIGCAAHQAHGILGVVGPLDGGAFRDGHDVGVKTGLGDGYGHGRV